MDRQRDRFTYLYRQYINRACTYEEMQEFFGYVADPEYKDHMDAIAGEHLEQLLVPGSLPQIDWEFMYNKIIAQPGAHVIAMNEEAETPKIRFLWKKIAVAALILIMLGAGYWWLVNNRKTEVATRDQKPSIQGDIQPGGNKAILTLGDNSNIVLDSVANGKLVQQGDASVIKQNEGTLIYTQQKGTGGKPLTYNTLTTPRGGEYHLILPDSSKVWLNAASSIRYPTTFTGNERKVAITGEAYFEVAHNANKPFMVSAGETTIEVLGTHFNINNYSDEEAVKTTLLEGKVRVAAKDKKGVLEPGQQAAWKNNDLLIVKDVDIEKTMAWQTGKFLFEHDELPEILRQISRWYDVDIVYEGARPVMHFSGIINRNRNISEVLSMLAATRNIHFTIEGKKIIVHP